MLGTDGSETWKLVPPEEKIELMSKAHSVGVLSAIIAIIIFSTIALALKIAALMWVGILVSPLIFQFSSGKSWRGLKPRVMLEYLGARSAARRFAFAEGARDLQVKLVFRGRLERLFDRPDLQEALEAAAQRTKEAEVWVALFRDTVVMLNERPGGAVLSYGHQINDKLVLQSSDQGAYTRGKEVTIISKEKNGEERKFKLTSKFPGALAVFEKTTLQLQSELKDRLDKDARGVTKKNTELESDDGDDMISRF